MRQGVELSWVHTAWHHKVTGALWSGTYQHRGLHLKESLAVKIAAHLHSHFMAQLKILSHSSTAQIQVAVNHAQVITAVGVILNSEWGSERFVQYVKLVSKNLNIARRNILIRVTTLRNHPLNLNHKLTAKLVSLGAQFCVSVLAEHKLSNAVAVTQVHKGHSAHLPYFLNPACQGHTLINIGDAQLATSHSSKHDYSVFNYYPQRYEYARAKQNNLPSLMNNMVISFLLCYQATSPIELEALLD